LASLSTQTQNILNKPKKHILLKVPILKARAVYYHQKQQFEKFKFQAQFEKFKFQAQFEKFRFQAQFK
jgi:hypothetical protein